MNQVQEFIETANDFANPLELARANPGFLILPGWLQKIQAGPAVAHPLSPGRQRTADA